MKTNRLALKIISAVALLMQVFFVSFSTARAYSSNSFGFGEGTGSFSIPEPMSVFSDIESSLLQQFHLSPSSLQNMSEGLNVSADKTNAPEVSLTFDPSEPKEGQKITAHSIPMYFSNSSEQLYFTWYLVHDDCEELTDSPSSSIKDECDADGDGRITINDWKVEAMRLIATNGYSNQDEPRPDYSSDGDSDEYKAPLGGDNKNKTYINNGGDYKSAESSYCYIHDFNSGANYEIGNTISSRTFYNIACPTGTRAACIKTSTDSLGNLSCGNTDFAPICDYQGDVECSDGTPKCVDELIFKNYYGNKTFYYTYPGEGYDSTLTIPGAGVDYKTTKCFDTDNGGTANDDCFSNDNRTIADDWEDAMSGGSGRRNLSGTGCQAKVQPDNWVDPWPPTPPFLQGRNYYVTDPSCSSTVVDESDGCNHLFAKTNGNGTTGDGDFGHVEEKFWGTNPQDPNTAGNGNLDEANVSGLGQDTFSWTYQKNDKVGVIVEGTSIVPTKYDDGSYMIMWALPKNIFYINQQSSKIQNIKGYDVQIPMAENTINNENSLKDNLVDPAEKTLERLDLSLSYVPENPINDASGNQMGDVISVNSVINNASGSESQIKYEWKIEGGTGYKSDMMKDLFNDKFIGGGKLEMNGSNYIMTGMGLSKINLKMDLGDKYKNYFDSNTGIGSFRITVTARESVNGKLRIGKGEVVVRVNSSSNAIIARTASVASSGKISFGSEICNKNDPNNVTNPDYYLCPVIKNQILGLEAGSDGFKNFSWTVNGVQITCDKSVSDLCSDSGDGNIIFFPITGNEGDTINVKMKANDLTTGRSIELNRTFQIVKPYVKIISKNINTLWPKLLGTYKNLDGTDGPADYSENNYLTYNNASVNVAAEFHPTYLDSNSIWNSNGGAGIVWKIDGEEAGNLNNLSLSVVKNIGEAYNIEASGFYQIPDLVRSALIDKWGISPLEINGELLSDSIQAEIVSSDTPVSLKNPGMFLASLISNLPSQMIFLLRTALTILVIIIIAGIAMNFSPSLYKSKE